MTVPIKRKISHKALDCLKFAMKAAKKDFTGLPSSLCIRFKAAYRAVSEAPTLSTGRQKTSAKTFRMSRSAKVDKPRTRGELMSKSFLMLSPSDAKAFFKQRRPRLE